MKVCEVKKFCCDEFQRFVGADGPQLTLSFSEAWHPAQRFEVRIPQENDAGIYIFSECPKPDWKLAADENASEVWYVGTSGSGMGGRVWTHLGPIIDPATGKQQDPPFRRNRWVNVPGVPIRVGEALAAGDFVIYTVKVETSEASPWWPAAVEKYLLLRHFLADRRLPILNLSF